MNEEALCARINDLLKNDKRTPDEIFNGLCNRLRQLAIEYGNPVPSDGEIEKGARNLIGLCEVIMK